MFTIDAHLDLSMNALEWNRDLRQPVKSINDREKGLSDKPDRGNATVSLPALREGNIGLVVATQIARYVSPGNPLPGWHSPQQAWAQTQGQLAWYRAMEAEGEMVSITDITSLDKHVALWLNDLFMQRVQQGGKWSLMDPDVCPGLTEKWGLEFNEQYEYYEGQQCDFSTFTPRP
ncbi:MAG: hypothetical protein EOP49_44165 [Sphingobacteriales bacterium]|nr:MAG: hypothetical protein EOP49_44165 [Sphingobacteriales bacterium]